MARKQKNKYYKSKPAPKQEESTESQAEAKAEVKTESDDSAILKKYTPYIVIFLFGALLYANTIPFDYVLDDKLYITGNEYTKQGIDGIDDHWKNDLLTGFYGKKKNLVEGGRYRPLPLTTHAIEWAVFKRNPHISHFINILIYGFLGAVLLNVLIRIFETSDSKKWWWNVAFIAAALFMAHPLHTEVGANIKSRDELMSTLFALLAFRSILIYLNKTDKLHLILSGVWFFMSLTSKESSLVFLGVIPLTMIFFPKGKLVKNIIALAPIAVVVVAYVALRTSVYEDLGKSMEVGGELMNKPYMLATDEQHIASIFFTIGLYIKLLFWPHPLTHDYYPFHPFRTLAELQKGMEPYVDWSNSFAMLSAILYFALVAYGVFALFKILVKKKRDVIGYGILIWIGTFLLYSNLIFDIGAFMNERFMFVPSLGFCIAIAWLLVEKLGNKKATQTLAIGIVALTLLGYSAKTFVRNYAWESDNALAKADVLTSDGSAKVKMTMGSELLGEAQKEKNPAAKKALLEKAERYCLNSLEIHPEYFPPLDILGLIYLEKKQYEYSVYYFQRAIQKKGREKSLLQKLEAAGTQAMNENQPKAAIAAFESLEKLYKGKDKARMYSNLGEVYGKVLQKPNEALAYLEKAKEVDPEDPGVYQKIGIIMAMGNRPELAMQNFSKALELDPENARVMLNIGILLQQQGKTAEGQQYIQKAQQIDPDVMKGL